MNSLDVLRKERDELASRVKALDSAIAALGGGKTRRGGRSYHRSAATKAKLSAALKASWAKRRKEKGK